MCASVQGRGAPGSLVCGDTRHVFHQVFVGKSGELHSFTLEQIRSSTLWRLKAAVNGTRKASKHWQEYSSDKLVTTMLFQQNDINPCIYKRFCDDLDLE